MELEFPLLKTDLKQIAISFLAHFPSLFQMVSLKHGNLFYHDPLILQKAASICHID